MGAMARVESSRSVEAMATATVRGQAVAFAMVRRQAAAMVCGLASAWSARSASVLAMLPIVFVWVFVWVVVFFFAPINWDRRGITWQGNRIVGAMEAGATPYLRLFFGRRSNLQTLLEVFRK